MTRDNADLPGEGLTPQAAFALLGNEYRAGIIRALGEAQGTEGPRVVLPFSELYAQVDPDIATGQFNYHLQKLVGSFIDRTEEGYRLRHEGVQLYRTIVAGTYTEASSVKRFEVGTDCFYCGSLLEARYADRRFTIFCSTCDRNYSDTTVPPSAIDTEADAVLPRINQYLRHRIMVFSKGICSNCANGIDTQFLTGAEVETAGSEQLDVFVHRACPHCGAQQYMSVGLSLLYDSQLIAFFENRGVDITETPVWELEFAMTDHHVNVRSSNPWEVALTVQQDQDELQLLVDGDLNIVNRTFS